MSTPEEIITALGGVDPVSLGAEDFTEALGQLYAAGDAESYTRLCEAYVARHEREGASVETAVENLVFAAEITGSAEYLKAFQRSRGLPTTVWREEMDLPLRFLGWPAPAFVTEADYVGELSRLGMNRAFVHLDAGRTGIVGAGYHWSEPGPSVVIDYFAFASGDLQQYSCFRDKELINAAKGALPEGFAVPERFLEDLKALGRQEPDLEESVGACMASLKKAE